MKRLTLAIMFVFCTLAMSAQDGIKVKFQGTSPDIMDFAWSWVTMMDGNPEDTPDESMTALRKSLEYYRTGAAQPAGYTITVDKNAGYILVEQIRTVGRCATGTWPTRSTNCLRCARNCGRRACA